MPPFFEDVEVGTVIPSLEHKIDLLELFRFSAATWNFYLLHLEKEFALKMGLEDVNIHGPLYGALIARMLTNWISDPKCLKKFSYKVTVMSFPDRIFVFKGKIIKKYEMREEKLVDCEIWVENQDRIIVASGSATLSLISK